jgi:hypothetical protein
MGIRQRGWRERKSNGLKERECVSIGLKWFLAWVRRNRTPEYV